MERSCCENCRLGEHGLQSCWYKSAGMDSLIGLSKLIDFKSFKASRTVWRMAISKLPACSCLPDWVRNCWHLLLGVPHQTAMMGVAFPALPRICEWLCRLLFWCGQSGGLMKSWAYWQVHWCWQIAVGGFLQCWGSGSIVLLLMAKRLAHVHSISYFTYLVLYIFWFWFIHLWQIGKAFAARLAWQLTLRFAAYFSLCFNYQLDLAMPHLRLSAMPLVQEGLTIPAFVLLQSNLLLYCTAVSCFDNLYECIMISTIVHMQVITLTMIVITQRLHWTSKSSISLGKLCLAGNSSEAKAVLKTAVLLIFLHLSWGSYQQTRGMRVWLRFTGAFPCPNLVYNYDTSWLRLGLLAFWSVLKTCVRDDV